MRKSYLINLPDEEKEWDFKFVDYQGKGGELYKRSCELCKRGNLDIGTMCKRCILDKNQWIKKS